MCLAIESRADGDPLAFGEPIERERRREIGIGRHDRTGDPARICEACARVPFELHAR
jgi:hypothetical protein